MCKEIRKDKTRKGRIMKGLIIILCSFVSAGIILPNAGQVVFGAATTSAKVGDTVKVGIFVEQIDAGLTQFTVGIPYNPNILEYAGVTGEGLQATPNIGTSYAEAEVKWNGTLEAGSSAHLGYVLFTVKKASTTGYRGTGTSPTALDGDGIQVAEIQVTPSEAIVQFLPRPLRVLLDLLVE